jgi:hypothetical protein
VAATGGAPMVSARSGRPQRPGPENDLVDRFLRDLRFPLNAGLRVTVFREPKLLSGFPDLVAVKWHHATAARWLNARATLGHDDIRLLHLLATNGPFVDADWTRYSIQDPSQSLQSLTAVGLVARTRGGAWRTAPMRDVFAVRSILAFEAKISSWGTAIEQAARNQWFASESYVVAPRGRRLTALVDAAKARGVGVWVEGARRPMLRAVRGDIRQPVSYASWLFNEWAWRNSLTASGAVD